MTKEIKIGLNGNHSNESRPVRVKLICEEVISNGYGSYISLGRDRNDITDQNGKKITSNGYGTKIKIKDKKNTEQTAAIDLCVGLGVLNEKYNNKGTYISSTKNNNSEYKSVYLYPDFKKDAARIYISELSDPDEYFGLNTHNTLSPNSRARSTVTLISDSTRIIGRESLKLVTHPKTVFDSRGKLVSKNSRGEKITSTAGIHLIAGNKPETLQPIVKGDYLVEALEKIVDEMTKVIESSLALHTDIISDLITKIGDHVHTGNLGAPVSFPQTSAADLSPLNMSLLPVQIKMADMQYNMLAQVNQIISDIKYQYLRPVATDEVNKYINSATNKVN